MFGDALGQQHDLFALILEFHVLAGHKCAIAHDDHGLRGRDDALGLQQNAEFPAFRVLLRTLHERRIRIGDVLRDFSLHAPVPGRITREQFIRGLSSIGVGSVSVDPRVIEGIANMYRIESDPMWVDSTACIRDLESTSYLRHLEQMAPETKNETFGRSVALSPNPRFIKHVLPVDEDARLQEVLGRLGEKAARDRVFNVRIFAAQFDKAKDVRAAPAAARMF